MASCYIAKTRAEARAFRRQAQAAGCETGKPLQNTILGWWVSVWRNGRELAEAEIQEIAGKVQH